MEKVYLMERDLVIKKNGKGVQIALLEDRRLVEFHVDNEKETFSTGNIYLGRIKKINPGLKAAFVSIGHSKEAFIHYTDLSPNIRSVIKYTQQAINNPKSPDITNFKKEAQIEKGGLIEKVLKKGDLILTQIMKEPISTKGPRLTCELSLPGRYIVLTPFGDTVGISKKIVDKDERKRLQSILKSVKPHNFGIVARTNAQGKETAEIHKDISNLLKKWENITQKLKGANPPKMIMSEIDKSLSIIRDIMNDSFSSISTDSHELHSNVTEYVQRVAPDKQNIIKLYKAKKPIFEAYNVNRQIKSAFGNTVTLKSGAYLVIEHTEALHVIDVNSGPKINRTDDQDTNAFKVNKEAAIEIGRQLRLRNIGGIIVVDFIDMKSAAYRNEILKVMQVALKPDKSKHSILPISKFGLMEITRQRSSAELTIDTTEPTPPQNGRMESCLLLIDEISRELHKSMDTVTHARTLYVHPFVEAYLRQRFKAFQRKWFMKYRSWLNIIGDSSFDLMEFTICDKNGEIIQ